MEMKKSFAEIRNAIQESLSKRPMNIHELSVDTKTNRKTIEKHLLYLEDIGVVKKALFNLRNGERILWKV